MSDVNDGSDDATMSSERLAQFQEEVGKLKVSAGAANPERLGGQWGIGLTIFGLVVAFISWYSAYNSADLGTNLRAQIFGIIGLAISMVGIILWIRNSMTRYLRYWIIRLVYEQREQTDRIIEALREKNE
jgi:hypothetical protein